ncbi:calpain-5 [Paragonimus westermani]|uniref:Calpain-5 n=1 Tax=Paragonimus westermani TaxID=34504 RepID=A0A5J4NCH5_9TREM|nr:calpain-5 [Paragonimus westermani]
MDIFKTSKNFKGQDFHLLKRQQLARGVKFVDDEFPLDAVNLPGFESSCLEFKRPPELVDCPCLQSADEYFSLKRGSIENLNILLAFASLKYCSKLWSKVFVDHSSQDWNKSYPNEHPGIFHVRIWQDGVFFDVTIDDRLPCHNGKLLSTCSSSAKEFWPAILEKAYAKLLGGYANLEYVRLEELLMDLTGGVTECINLQTIHSAPPMKHVEFYEKLEQALKEGTFVIFCTEPSYNPTDTSQLGLTNHEESTQLEQFGSPGPMDGQMNAKTGLCARYGYLLTRLCTVPKDTSLFGAIRDVFRRVGDCPIRTRLVRLRCPLTVAEGGAGLGEWTGAYSACSPEWEDLGLEVRRRLRLAFDSEAEFWMPLDDLLEYMTGAMICRLPDTSVVSLTGRTWQLNEHHGAWHGHQAGGSLRFRDSFFDNPQVGF